MPDRSNTESVGEYGALIAAGTVAILTLIVVLVVIVASGDDEPRRKTATKPASLPPRTIEQFATGVQIRRPKGWRATRTGRGLNMRSPDRYVALSISLPPGGRSNTAVLSQSIAAIRQQYGKVQVGQRSGRRIANLPTVSVVASATNDRGVRLNILSAAAQGRRRAWLVQVFAANRAPNKRLAEAQRALNSLRLRG